MSLLRSWWFGAETKTETDTNTNAASCSLCRVCTNGDRVKAQFTKDALGSMRSPRRRPEDTFYHDKDSWNPEAPSTDGQTPLKETRKKRTGALTVTHNQDTNANVSRNRSHLSGARGKRHLNFENETTITGCWSPGKPGLTLADMERTQQNYNQQQQQGMGKESSIHLPGEGYQTMGDEGRIGAEQHSYHPSADMKFTEQLDHMAKEVETGDISLNTHYLASETKPAWNNERSYYDRKGEHRPTSARDRFRFAATLRSPSYQRRVLEPADDRRSSSEQKQRDTTPSRTDVDAQMVVASEGNDYTYARRLKQDDRWQAPSIQDRVELDIDGRLDRLQSMHASLFTNTQTSSCSLVDELAAEVAQLEQMEKQRVRKLFEDFQQESSRERSTIQKYADRIWKEKKEREAKLQKQIEDFESRLAVKRREKQEKEEQERKEREEAEIRRQEEQKKKEEEERKKKEEEEQEKKKQEAETTRKENQERNAKLNEELYPNLDRLISRVKANGQVLLSRDCYHREARRKINVIAGTSRSVHLTETSLKQMLRQATPEQADVILRTVTQMLFDQDRGGANEGLTDQESNARKTFAGASVLVALNRECPKISDYVLHSTFANNPVLFGDIPAQNVDAAKALGATKLFAAFVFYSDTPWFGWTVVSRMLNNACQRKFHELTPATLAIVLKYCGNALSSHYQNQFRKLIMYLSNHVLPLLERQYGSTVGFYQLQRNILPRIVQKNYRMDPHPDHRLEDVISNVNEV